MNRVCAMAVCLVVVVVAASCTPEDEPPATSAEVPTAVPRIEDGTTSGVASSFGKVEVDPQNPRERETVPPPGALDLRGCRWRGPGLYTFDLSFDPDGGTDLPVSFPVSLMRVSGDMGTSALGQVTVTGAGDFSVTVNENQRSAEYNRTRRERSDDDQVRGDPFREATWSGRGAPGGAATAGWDMAAVPSFSCQARWDGADETEGEGFSESREPTMDLFDDGFEMPEGSLEALARSVDLTTADDPMAALRSLLAHEDLPIFDRLYVAPGSPLSRIDVSFAAECLAIESQYVFDIDWLDVVMVHQRLGCPDPLRSGSRPVIGVVDDVWDVEVTGPRDRVEAFVESDLERRHMATVDPFEPGDGVFDPGAALDAEVAERGLTEVARFPWHDGVVAIVLGGESNWGQGYEAIVKLPSGPLLGGGGGIECRTHSGYYWHDGRFGFAWVVTEDPGLNAEMVVEGGPAVEVSLEPALGDRQAGMVDISDLPATSQPSFVVTDADGRDVGCDQTPTTQP